MSSTGGEPAAKKCKMNKNKKVSYFKKGQKKQYIEAGQRGFLATTNFRERECARECYNLLNHYADQLYGPENVLLKKGDTDKDDDKKSASDDDDDANDIATELESDIKSAAILAQANRSKDRRFLAVETGSANCIFIRTTLPDTVELSTKIITDMAETRQSRTRNVLRFLPIESICKANLADILNAAGQLFDKHFLNVPPTSFAINYNKRCNDSLDRMEIIRELADLVTSKNMAHRVDLNNSDVTIVVEVVKGLCCLAVVPQYIKFKKYNLTELTAPPKAPAKATDDVKVVAAATADEKEVNQTTEPLKTDEGTTAAAVATETKSIENGKDSAATNE